MGFETLRDPRSAPPVLARHPPDKLSDLPSDRCPAWRPSPPGEPPPVEAEACAVPPDHRLRLHDDDSLGPSCPHAPQHDAERPVHQPDPRPTLLQDGGELLTESQVLDHEAALRPEPRDHSSDDRPEESTHGGRRGSRPWPKTSTVPSRTQFWRGTGGAAAQWARSPPTACFMIASSLASARASSPTMVPSRMTRTRSLMPRTSGSSEEIMMMPTPRCVSSFMIW
jgi:hypothetical protein